MPSSPLEVRGVNLDKIRNRNERRVVRLMADILDEYYTDYILEEPDIEDIYALALNLLPARYAQQGSIVIQNRLSDFEIKSKVRQAAERVLENPTRYESS